jgi:pimeloyl-ACP methyl ester carboxylesterase
MAGEMTRGVPAQDFLVEGRAEQAYDSRAVLPRITAPVLLVVGDRDRAFPWAYVEETAGLIPDCTVVKCRGRGHVGTAMSRRVPRNVLAFLGSRERAGRR